jgi:hypothetical protein
VSVDLNSTIFDIDAKQRPVGGRVIDDLAKSAARQIAAGLFEEDQSAAHAIRQAEELEQKDQPGSSLAWFLKAQSEYPASEFARQGVERLTKQILLNAS